MAGPGRFAGDDVEDTVTAAYEPGDLVTVRREEQISVIVAPTTRPPDCELPDDTPDVTVCCVPIALVRTPAADDAGALRWVEVADLVRVEAESAAPDGSLRPGAVGVLQRPLASCRATAALPARWSVRADPTAATPRPPPPRSRPPRRL